MPPRGTDVVEVGMAWLLTALGLVGLLAAILVGDEVHERLVDPAREHSPHPPARTLVDEGDHAFRSGAPHRGGVTALTPLASGNPATPPRGNQTGRVADGAGTSLTTWTYICWSVALALAGVIVALGLVWRLVAGWTASRNSRRWARDWADVEPRWSGRRGR